MEIIPDLELAEELRAPGADKRIGVNLIVRPPASLRAAIGALQARLGALEPEQHLYPPEDLHLTLLELGSEMSAFDAADLAERAAAILPRLLAAAPETPALCLSEARARCDARAGFVRFEVAPGLLPLRLALLDGLRGAGLSLRPRYVNEVAHITICRYLAPLRGGWERWAAGFGPLSLDAPWRLDTLYLSEGATWYGRRDRLRLRGPWALGS